METQLASGISADPDVTKAPWSDGRGATVTVVIPAFNVGRYLQACLESVIGQTSWSRCQIIVIDDGSTDDTAEVATRYEDGSRIRIVRQPNRGPGAGAARNHGLDLVDTEYVLFLDGDDELSPKAIELLAGALDREGLNLAVGATEQFPDGRTWLWSRYFTPNHLDRVQIEQVPLLVHDARTCNKLYRTRWLVDSGLRFAEGIHHQDTVVNVPAMLQSREFMLVGDVVHRYRKRAEGGSVMDSHYTRIDNFWDHLQVIESLSAIVPRLEPSRQPLMAEFIARSFQGFAWRSPEVLPKDRLREFFDRTSAVVNGLPLAAFKTATRNAQERAAYVTMLEDDFDSFATLPEHTSALNAYDGQLYLAVPCTDPSRRELLRTGSPRARIDLPMVTGGSLQLRLRLRIPGATHLVTAVDRLLMRGLHNGKERFRRELTLTPTEQPQVFGALLELPLRRFAPGAYRFRLRFETPTGDAERWVRRPVNESGITTPDEIAVGRMRHATLVDADGVAELRLTEAAPLAIARRLRGRASQRFSTSIAE